MLLFYSILLFFVYMFFALFLEVYAYVAILYLNRYVLIIVDFYHIVPYFRTEDKKMVE